MSAEAEQPTLRSLARDFAVAARTVIDAAEALDHWLAEHGDNEQARAHLKMVTDLHLTLVRIWGDEYINEPLRFEDSVTETIDNL